MTDETGDTWRRTKNSLFRQKWTFTRRWRESYRGNKRRNIGFFFRDQLFRETGMTGERRGGGADDVAERGYLGNEIGLGQEAG